MRKISHKNSGNPKKFEPTPAKFIIGTFIILFAITGCSDLPYTGSHLADLEVNRYLVSTDGESICFQDDFEATCIRLTPETGNPADATNGPTVYIYPERRVHTFYYEGKPILHAERVQITTTPPEDNPPTPNGDNGSNNNNNGGNGGDNGGDNGDNGGDNGDNGGDNGDNGDDNGDNGSPPGNSNDGHGWIIWVYYPEGAAPRNAPTLGESGVTVTINGKQLTDEDITGFAQFIGSDGERGVQFFYPTESAELLDLKIRVEGVVSDDETVKFNINYLWNAR